MLQPVIRDDDISTVGNQHLGSSKTIGVNDDRASRKPCEQYRFVTNHRWITGHTHAYRRRRFAATVTAADDTG